MLLRRLDVVFLTIEDVLVAHQMAITTSCDPGIRDAGILASATMAPQNAYVDTLAELAGLYAYGICQAHAFVDGNKRAALLSTWAFLEANGYPIQISEHVGVNFMLAIANGEVNARVAGMFFEQLIGTVQIL
jgi:death-on-curing protein